MAIELGVPESELTWVVSAYPLSAVSRDFSGNLCITEHLGLSPSNVRSNSRSLWTQKSFLLRSCVVSSIYLGSFFCQQYVRLTTSARTSIDIYSSAAMTLDILRGFQGVGAAATIPASVCVSLNVILKFFVHRFDSSEFWHMLFLLLARVPSHLLHLLLVRRWAQPSVRLSVV